MKIFIYIFTIFHTSNSTITTKYLLVVVVVTNRPFTTTTPPTTAPQQWTLGLNLPTLFPYSLPLVVDVNTTSILLPLDSRFMFMLFWTQQRVGRFDFVVLVFDCAKSMQTTSPILFPFLSTTHYPLPWSSPYLPTNMIDPLSIFL